MSKGSSHQEATTANTYTDLGAQTKEAYAISLRSRTLARQVIGDRSIEDRVRQRCSVAVGDFVMADLMRFQNDPIAAGLEAVKKGALVITDIRMVEVGIQKLGHHCPVICSLDYGEEQARELGITRTSAGFLALKDQVEGSIVVIGNAPSALLTVCQMIRDGIRPAIVIGIPVGFVNAKESKEVLRTMVVPSISCEGTRGGTPVAVAALNEIITIHSEGQDA
jgi:precorrin-8X/cobalt-precorrin-8 methylmutase